MAFTYQKVNELHLRHPFIQNASNVGWSGKELPQKVSCSSLLPKQDSKEPGTDRYFCSDLSKSRESLVGMSENMGDFREYEFTCCQFDRSCRARDAEYRFSTPDAGQSS